MTVRAISSESEISTENVSSIEEVYFVDNLSGHLDLILIAKIATLNKIQLAR